MAILFSNRVDHEVIDTVKDTDENILLLRTRINGIEIAIGSIYGPNTENCDKFFSTIKNTARSWNGFPCIFFFGGGGIGMQQGVVRIYNLIRTSCFCVAYPAGIGRNGWPCFARIWTWRTPSELSENRLDMINLQMHVKTVESAQRKTWTQEVIRLKRENYEGNIDRIIFLEGN